MSGALQRCLEECLKLITLSVIGNRFAVVAVEIRPPPARTKIGPLASYDLEVRRDLGKMASPVNRDHMKRPLLPNRELPFIIRAQC